MTAAAILQLIIALLPDIEELSSQLAAVVPIAKKILAGTEPTAEDIETLAAIQTAVNAQAAALGG